MKPIINEINKVKDEKFLQKKIIIKEQRNTGNLSLSTIITGFVFESFQIFNIIEKGSYNIL